MLNMRRRFSDDDVSLALAGLIQKHRRGLMRQTDTQELKVVYRIPGQSRRTTVKTDKNMRRA